MNKAADLVTKSLNNKRFKTIIVGDKVYSIRPLTIKIICRVLEEFAKIEVEPNKTLFDVLITAPLNAPSLLKGVAYAIAGDIPNHEEEVDRIVKELELSTWDEIREAIDTIISFMGAKDFFQCAISAESVAKIAGRM